MTPIYPQSLWNDLVRYLQNDPYDLITRYIADFNASYWDLKKDRRRAFAYFCLVALAVLTLAALSSLVPGVDEVMGLNR